MAIEHNLPRIYALIVAAGSGSRAGGDLPKQYQKIAGKALLRYSAEALLYHPQVDGVMVVIHPDHQQEYEQAMLGLNLLPVAYGGALRSDSVRAGLNALTLYHPDYVLVHDAARPFLSQAMIGQLIAQLAPEQAVLPALPVADTVRRQHNGTWEEVARDGLLRIQTPQGFPFDALKKAYAAGHATDEAALWLAANLPLTYVIGEEELRKVTTSDDIAWANRQARTGRRTAIGQGYDVHALMPAGEKRTIRLGGIDIEHDYKLHGHSDADVVLHAIVDALLGAIAAGDIGGHFSPSDERWRGADSELFVQEAMRLVMAQAGLIQHLDITIICEAPKIGPHREAMRTRIASMLGLALSHVSVKATTTEKLGFTGRSEGIAAQAIATLSLPEVA